jgi:hypothetical protein
MHVHGHMDMDTIDPRPVAMAAAQPKLDLKMLVVPAALFFSRKIDFKDPQVQQQWQTIFLSGKLLYLLGKH